jgi:hypothetical protein
MRWTSTRYRVAALLALGSGLGLAVPGCGGSRQADVSVSQGGEGPGIPDATVAELRACVENGRGRLKETTYAFQFAVTVTEDGHADRVRLKDSFPGDGEMEACLARALEDMSVAGSLVQALIEQVERAGGVSPASRGPMGEPTVMILGISLNPVVLAAIAVTAVVAVSIYAAKELVETAKRNKKVEALCKPLFDKCLGSPWQPEWNRANYGTKMDCLGCYWGCQRHGKWNFDKCPVSN